ncbi:MAG: shikimate dehydrogenase [Ilumatobacteraceae bacterium]
MITATTRVAGVIGSPVRHSLSPVIHNAAFAASGLDWVYAAFDVAAGGGGAAVAAMHALGIAGLSVTMPHKHDVAAAVDVIDEASAALAAVNTVVRQPDGRLAGHSTDGDGFVASLREAGCDPAAMNVVVLGAGGAARAVIHALGRSGAERVIVVNRSAGRAGEAAALAGGRGVVGEAGDLRFADLVVNATSVGMWPVSGAAAADLLPLDPALLESRHIVADLVYHPLETPLLRAARRCGAVAIDGLAMLVHQAVLQQELWTGRRPDPTIMRAAAENEVARRAAAAGAGTDAAGGLHE